MKSGDNASSDERRARVKWHKRVHDPPHTVSVYIHGKVDHDHD